MAEEKTKPTKKDKKPEEVKTSEKTEAEKTIEASVKKEVEEAVKKVKTSKKVAKSEPKPELEREYVIPLREKCRPVPRYKKTNKAIKTIKEFLARHMKVRDRDLDKIKLNTYLNEFLWSQGIRHPPHKVKVKAIKVGGIVTAELVELPKKLSNKKARTDKMEQMLLAAGDKKKKSKAPEKKEEKQSEKDMKEESEKKSAVVEAGKDREKAMAKKSKHTAKGSEKSPIVQRKALSR